MRLPDFARSLVILCLVSAVLSAATDSAGQRPLSDYFPADTLVFIEIPDMPRLREDAKATGLYGLWSDDSMGAIRAYVLKSRAEAEAGSGFGALGLALDFVESIEGGAGLGLVKGAEGFEYLFVARVGENTEAAKALLDSVYAEETADGAPPTSIEISGVSARVSGVDGEHSAIADGMVFIGSKYAFTGALDRRNAASNAGSLTASVGFTKAASFIPKGPYAYRIVLDFPSLYDEVKAFAARLAPLEVDELFNTLGINDIETVSMVGVMSLSGVVDHLYISMRTADAKLIDMTGRSAVDEGRLSVVPREALFFGARSMDMQQAYESNIELLALFRSMTGTDLEAIFRQFEQSAGVSVERDIIPALGKASIGYFSLEGETTLFSIIQGASVSQASLLEVTDEEAVKNALAKIANYVKTDPQILGAFASGPQGPLQLETTTLGDMTVYSLVHPSVQFLSPSVAVAKGYLVYSNSKRSLISAVDRLIAPAASILDNADYIRARSALGKEPTQIAYVNLDSVIDIIYDNAFSSIAKSVDAAHNRQEIPFTSADLPQAFRVKKNLDGIAMGVVTSGNLVDVQVYSPFGLGVAVVGAVLPAIVGGFETPAPVFPVDETVSPERQRLMEIGNLLQLSTVERQGRFPDNIADVISAEKLQAPQDSDPESPLDYEYVAGLSVYSPGRKIIVYERKGLQGDGRHVLYVDGTVEFLTEDEFQKALRAPGAEEEPPAEEEPSEESEETETAE